MSQEDMKQAVKEAAKEWLDEQYRSLGRWTARAMALAFFGAMVLFWLKFR